MLNLTFCADKKEPKKPNFVSQPEKPANEKRLDDLEKRVKALEERLDSFISDR